MSVEISMKMSAKQAGKLYMKSLNQEEEIKKLKASLSRYSMSAGQADQFRAEAQAVREALGFGKDSDEVSPSDLLSAIQRLNDAELIRINGRGGVQIYATPITEQSAKEFYMDEYGEEAERVDVFRFDTCTGVELRQFADRGND